MYYLRLKSLRTDVPAYQKLEPDGLLFPEKTIAYDFANTGLYEQTLMDWALSMMPPGKVFVDIGAHVGTWSFLFAEKASHIYSFECTPRTYNFLCGNIALHNLDDKITAQKMAIGNTNGMTTVYVRSEDGGGNSCLFTNGVPHTVPIATLDSLNLSNVGMIKIDVEGFEKNVIEGMQETLRRNNYPIVLFESWEPWRETAEVPATQLRKELFDYIRSIGYKPIQVNGWQEMFLLEKVNV